MNLIEKNRNIEPHDESILFLYLQDANGVPLPNQKVKIYAGPPPTGEPPYFVDDDPNNPNRRTDANGKFQFVVANGAPTGPLDFYVRVLDANGEPQSGPVHFPFPAGEARWVIVTLAPQASPDPTGIGGIDMPPRVPELDLDPRLAQITRVEVRQVQPSSGQTYWKLISAKYQDPEESGGNVNIVCFVQDERGAPLPGTRVDLRTSAGDTASALTNERGHCDHVMGRGAGFDPARERGPLAVFVDGLPSDEVNGMGLPLNRHVQYILTWRRAVGVAGAPTAPTPGPTLTAPASPPEGMPEPLPGPLPAPEAPITPPAPTAPAPEPQPAGNVRGRIGGAPAGARLVLRSPGRLLDALVGSDGLYSFNAVPPGTYSLELTGVGVINPALSILSNRTTAFDYPTTVPAPAKKVFKHYLLFGPGTLPGTLTNLILALDYIVHFAPVAGFSVEEALNADHVTIVGGPTAVTVQDEQRLRAGGAQVARLQATDSYALENLFQQLLASGSPYPR